MCCLQHPLGVEGCFSLVLSDFPHVICLLMDYSRFALQNYSTNPRATVRNPLEYRSDPIGAPLRTLFDPLHESLECHKRVIQASFEGLQTVLRKMPKRLPKTMASFQRNHQSIIIKPIQQAEIIRSASLNLRLQASDAHPQASDGHPKPAYVHPKLMNGDFAIVMTSVISIFFNCFYVLAR